jgi:hypothetical protein
MLSESLTQHVYVYVLVQAKGGFTSIKYMILPGLNDERKEVEELCAFVEETRIDMIQWRNIAIDPEYYLSAIKYSSPLFRAFHLAYLVGTLTPRCYGHVACVSGTIRSGTSRQPRWRTRRSWA